jgi:hypothetical protein
MNINELTIGQVKEISELFGGQADKKSTMLSSYIGKYVICRSRNEGVNAGFVKDIDETGVILEDARRLYYHKPANKEVSWYEGVAKHGISNDSKVGTAAEKCIIEDYSLTVCTDLAKNSLIEAKDHEQN